MERVLSGLRAAAEPTRLRLLALLAQGDLTVSELTHILGQSQPRVSRHLKLMCDSGLLDRFPEGAWVFYRLAAAGPGAELARALLPLLPGADRGLAADRLRLDMVRQSRAERAQRYFTENAARWDQIRSLQVDDSQVERELVQAFQGQDIDLLIDMGTGTGRVLEVLAPMIRQGVGVDLSREMLAVARANLERAGCRHCMVRQGDITQVPFADSSADAVTVHQVLHYADEPAQVVAEAARVLKPGGLLMLVDLAPHDLEFLRDQQAHRRLGFSDAEVASWLGAAGLVPSGQVRLPGDPLTVVLWRAIKKQDV